MRLVIDLQSCQGNGRFRGIGRYSTALARAMSEQNDPQQTFVVTNNLFPDSENSIRSIFSSVIPAHNIKTFQILPNTSYKNAHSNGRLHANSCLREHFISGLTPDVVHVSSMFEGLGEDIVTSVNLIGSDHATGVTIYDFIPLSNPKEYLPYKIHRDWYASKVEEIKLVDTLLSISESARQEAINIVGIPPEKIINISSAAGDFFRKIDNDTVSSEILIKNIGISKNFFMYTANYEPRKNYDRLIRAFAQIPSELRDGYQLVLVLSANAQVSAEIYMMIKREGLQKSDIVITGSVSDQLLRLLYSTCHMLVYPSLHEGFGLPVLEAMQCGAAVIGSNTTSIPEVIGRSDAMFNPLKVDEITALMIRSITDDGFLSMLREHGPRQAAKFSWKESARIALSALKESAERKMTAERSTGTLYGRFVRACSTQISSMSAPDVAAVASALTANSRQLTGSV